MFLIPSKLISLYAINTYRLTNNIKLIMDELCINYDFNKKNI